jgi:hypothetical protein
MASRPRRWKLAASAGGAALACLAGCHDFSAIKPALTSPSPDASRGMPDGSAPDRTTSPVDAHADTGTRILTDASIPSFAGVVRRYERIDGTAFLPGADLDAWNIAISSPSGTSDVSPKATSLADGSFDLTDLPAGAAAELWVRPSAAVDLLPNGKSLPLAFRTDVSVRVPTALPAKQDLPLVSYAWLSQVAVDCGIFPDLDTALYGAGGNTTNDYFVTRSVVIGELQSADGGPYTGPPIGPDDISVVLDNGTQYVNRSNNPNDTTNTPATRVCFLDSNTTTGEYVGSASAVSTAANRFVMFRVRNAGTAIGNGAAVVHVTGFAPASVYLLASGSVGVVALRVGTDPKPPATVSFDDVYSLLKTDALNCVSACHTPPDGVGYQMSMARGPMNTKLDLSTQTAALAALQAGESASCVGANASVVARLCPGDPARSLLLTVPLTQSDNRSHPYPVFDSTSDPNYLLIYQWISNLPAPQ